MKTITKYIYHVIFLNCIGLLNLSADSHMLKFNTLEPEQKNIHAFLCRQAVSKDYKDTKNRFSVAISFVFENGARKTFLVKAPGDKVYFESGSLGIAKKHRYKAQLGDIIRGKKIGNYINRKLRNNEYPEEEKYRLGDSEVSFLYAINCDPDLQEKCVQSLAKEIIHKLARIELHGFTTRDMCPCCYSYMDCFLEQSNKINLKSEKTNNADPENKGKGANENSSKDVFDNKGISKQFDNGNKNENANLGNDNDFQNFFECLLDQESIKKYLPKDNQIPINFFISSLVGLSGKAYECGVYKKGKLTDAKEIDTESGNNLYCILLRKEGSENLSQENITIENKDCFYLDASGEKCRFCGNHSCIEACLEKNKHSKEENFCGIIDNGFAKWYDIYEKPYLLSDVEYLKNLKQKCSEYSKESEILRNNDVFAFDEELNGGYCVGNYKTWNNIKWLRGDRYCVYYLNRELFWGHIERYNGHVNEFPTRKDARAFKQAKAIYNANHIFENKNGLDEAFGRCLDDHAKQITDNNEEDSIYKVASGCTEPTWCRDLKDCLNKSNNTEKEEKQQSANLKAVLDQKYQLEVIRKDKAELIKNVFASELPHTDGSSRVNEVFIQTEKNNTDGTVSDKTNELFLKKKYNEEKIPDVNVFKILNGYVKNEVLELKENFLVLIEGCKSLKTFKRSDKPDLNSRGVELEELDTDNTLFLYYDGEKYYKITPKTESEDAKKMDVQKGDSKGNSKDPFKISSSENNSLKEKTKNNEE